jgi:thermitase
MRLSEFLPKRYRLFVAVLLVFLLAVPLQVSAQSQGSTVSNQQVTQDWIVKLNLDTARFQSSNGVVSFLGDATHRTLGSDSSTFVVSFDGETQATNAIARMMQDPAVEYVEPDLIYEYQQEIIPNDPGFVDQQWAQTVNLPEAWTIATGTPEVVVAVVDSGIRSDHPDLQGQLVEGRNYVDVNLPGHDPTDTDDRIGHGTGVAGIIAAIGNNETGIAGTAMNVRLMPMRVGDNGGAPISRIAIAVEDAVNMGADVINLSLGSDNPSATLETRLDYAVANNVIVVAASGNKPEHVSFPGTYNSTISVGATSLDGSDMAWFSSRVSDTDVVAPGMDVLTTWYDSDEGNTYRWVQGTSFSTPIVSGVAAIVSSINPDLNVHQMRTLLRETAQMTFAEGTTGTGSGLLDANAAVRQALLPSFGSTWLSADEPVASTAATRSWLWGPYAFDMRVEPYEQAEFGYRLIAYFDKSRMEITDPYGDRSSEWFVTNGLLVNELISGDMQVGDAQFESRQPAEVPVAGDPDDSDGPTYASFTDLTGGDGQPSGVQVTQTLDRDGSVGDDPEMAQYGVTSSEFVDVTGYAVADVFWEYLNSSGLIRQPGAYVEGRIFNPTFFATGFPVTDAYWSRVTVDTVEQDVLIQCFERRCLTFTPDNDPGWQVEMGNVGQHYYRWRYDENPGSAVVQDPASYAVNNLR